MVSMTRAEPKMAMLTAKAPEGMIFTHDLIDGLRDRLAPAFRYGWELAPLMSYHLQKVTAVFLRQSTQKFVLR